mmetsp:Transcript_49928/g.159702  ORF Transcript_49928/g.159702 Transcript_49928/m.159702 type:complete len:208 (-) Transcript_49928:157-780(-)
MLSVNRSWLSGPHARLPREAEDDRLTEAADAPPRLDGTGAVACFASAVAVGASVCGDATVEVVGQRGEKPLLLAAPARVGEQDLRARAAELQERLLEQRKQLRPVHDVRREDVIERHEGPEVAQAAAPGQGLQGHLAPGPGPQRLGVRAEAVPRRLREGVLEVGQQHAGALRRGRDAGQACAAAQLNAAPACQRGAAQGHDVPSEAH